MARAIAAWDAATSDSAQAIAEARLSIAMRRVKAETGAELQGVGLRPRGDSADWLWCEVAAALIESGACLLPPSW